MKLDRFRVTHYRSIKDSGWIGANQRTVLVGRNECGKSNLLLALCALNPPGGLERLSIAKDFPADRSRSEYTDELPVVRTMWALSHDEREELGRIFAPARKLSHVEVGRGYLPECWVRFGELPPGKAERAQPIDTMVGEDVALELDDDSGITRVDGAQELFERLTGGAEVEAGEEAAVPESAAPEPDMSVEAEGEKAARDWVLQRLPSFGYLDEYPDIEGHQNLVEFLKRQKEQKPGPKDLYFEQLLAAAGLNPRSVETILTADPDTRRQLVSHAGRVITRKLRELWSDRALKVRFDLDGEHFHTLVSDPNSLYDVEINLDERSRGFRWFFSFYVAFAAQIHAAPPAILLLDEPGTHLHAKGQRDLLDHLARDFDNQVILATQSPFMVPVDALEDVRSVSISEDAGTAVSNTPAGDETTLFPIVHALGSELAKGLLDGQRNLVVESITDYWYLLSISNFLRDRGGATLPKELTITPAGGATAVLGLMALLSSDSVPAIVLMTRDGGAHKLVSSGLVANDRVVFVGEGFADSEGISEVEDLLDARAYERCVRFAYKDDLKDQNLELTDGPGLVSRVQDIFTSMGIRFSRERVARVFLRALSQSPDAALPVSSQDRFERLFRTIRARMDHGED